MLKFKLHHILSVCVGVVVVGGLVYINTSSYFSTSPVDGEAPTAPVATLENPLLKATKRMLATGSRAPALQRSICSRRPTVVPWYRVAFRKQHEKSRRRPVRP